MKPFLSIWEKVSGVIKIEKPLTQSENKTHPTIDLPTEVRYELQKLISKGDGVLAVKRVINLTKTDLKTAREYVESLKKAIK